MVKTFVSKRYKEVLQLNNKMTDLEMRKDLNGHLNKKDTKMANMFTEKMLTSITSRKVQIKTSGKH